MAIGALVFNSIIPSVARYCSLPWNGQLSMYTTHGLLIFPNLGYLFANINFTKRQQAIIYTLGIASIVIRYGGTYILSMKLCVVYVLKRNPIIKYIVP